MTDIPAVDPKDIGIEQLQARIEALKKALARYGCHLVECPQYTGPYDLGELEPPCTCGFDAALAAEEEACPR